MKKVDKSQLDKPSVLLQEQRGELPVTSNNTGGVGAGVGAGAGAGAGAGGSLQDALAAALNSRKQKVSNSDVESDGEDW